MWLPLIGSWIGMFSCSEAAANRAAWNRRFPNLGYGIAGPGEPGFRFGVVLREFGGADETIVYRLLYRRSRDPRVFSAREGRTGVLRGAECADQAMLRFGQASQDRHAQHHGCE